MKSAHVLNLGSAKTDRTDPSSQLFLPWKDKHEKMLYSTYRPSSFALASELHCPKKDQPVAVSITACLSLDILNSQGGPPDSAHRQMI